VSRRPPDGGPAYQRVLAALRAAGSRYGGGQDWTCPHPQHDDHKASLGVSEGRNGRVLLNCMRNCPTPEVVTALGLTMGDLAPDEDHPADYQLAVTYDYTDELGAPLYRVLRYECTYFPGDPCPSHKKEIKQQVWRNGGWRGGRGCLDGVRRVLYRLPEVLAAVESGEPVYIFEGEKDADRAVAEELVCATTNAQGAGNWRDEYAEVLAGATVIVVPDHDRAGYEHARTVYESCVRAGASVSLALPKPRHPGADYSDHADADYGLSSLEPVQLDDLVWVEADSDGGPSSWAPVDLTAYLDGTYKPDEPTLLRRSDGQPLLYAGKVSALYGESESGKSWLAQCAAAEVLTAGGRVLYLDFEDSPGAVTDRLLRLGVALDDAARRFLYVQPERNLSSPGDRAAFEQLLSSNLTLAVLDGVTDAMGVFELKIKDNDDVATFMRDLPRRLARDTGAAVVMVDHVTKDREGRGRYAIGGQHKLAAIDGAAYTVEVRDPLGRGLSGVVDVRLGKDRPGALRGLAGPMRAADRTQDLATFHLEGTAESGRLTWRLDPPGTDADRERDLSAVEDPAAVNKVLLDVVIEYVRDNPGAGFKQMERDLKPRKDGSLRRALDAALDAGDLRVEQGPNRRLSHYPSEPGEGGEDG
jgi:hypothetical protein